MIFLFPSSVHESRHGAKRFLMESASRSCGASPSSVGTASSECHFEGCDFGTASLQLAHIDKGGFSGTVTFTLAGDYNIHDSYSKGDTAPVFTKTAGQAIVAEFQNYAGDITVNGLEAGDTIELGGFFRTITLAGSGGIVHVHGHYETISSGSFSGTLSITGAIKTADVASILEDTETTIPATLPVALVSGRMDSNASAIDDSATAAGRLSLMFAAAEVVVVDDATFTPTTTVFETEDTVDDPQDYNQQVLFGVTGANAGVTVKVTSYEFSGNSKVKLTVSQLESAPADGDTFIKMGRIGS